MSKPALIFITPENGDRIKHYAQTGEAATCRGCGFEVIGPHDCPGPLNESAEVKTDESDKSPEAV